MNFDLKKEPGRLAVLTSADLTCRQRPVVPTTDWIAMFRAFDTHVNLYCASADLKRGKSLKALDGKLAKCAASIPDALALVVQERSYLDAEWEAELAALQRGEQRKTGTDRRAGE